jgi:manganese/iron transport system permease protein/iron/zinc/copper transport system permease protein
MIVVSAVIGAVGYWLGFAAAVMFGASPGAAVVVTMTMLFLVVLVVAPRYGLLADWIRQARSVPQELMEDVLGAVWRSDNNSIARKSLSAKVSFPGRRIRRAINSLLRQNYLVQSGEQISLTGKGQREAGRLVRAHRLWETYLTRTGIPETEIHVKAHQLEHINDEATVDYLDDKLGHPLTDPHGSEIPVDVERLELQSEFKASLLRSGHTVEICEIGPSASNIGLSIGQIVTAGRRSTDGRTWRLKSFNREFELNHQQADEITVRFVGK